jgi:hypothetical protein
MSTYTPYIPTPNEWEGVPFIVTDAIPNTEAAVGAEAGT